MPRKKLTNQQRIDKEDWVQADLDKIVCPECPNESMHSGSAYKPVTGNYGYVRCKKCGWSAERPIFVVEEDELGD